MVVNDKLGCTDRQMGRLYRFHQTCLFHLRNEALCKNEHKNEITAANAHDTFGCTSSKISFRFRQYEMGRWSNAYQQSGSVKCS
jgi:hypothetical protein